MSDRLDADRRDASVTHTQLDALVVTIELTLVSIVQGVALSFLADPGTHRTREWAILQLALCHDGPADDSLVLVPLVDPYFDRDPVAAGVRP